MHACILDPVTLTLIQDGIEVRATTIQIEPESWDGYVWSTADYKCC